MVKISSRLGLIAALPAEARTIAGRRGWRRRNGWKIFHGTPVEETTLMCVCCGMGAENAYHAACWLIAQGVSALSVMGVSGGLNPDLTSGDMVVPESILEARCGRPCRQWIPEPRLADAFRERVRRAHAAVTGGAILTAEAPVLTRQQKAALFAATGAQSVDLESAAVARAAAAGNLPMFAFRTIADTAADDVAAEHLDLIKPDGSIRWLFLMGYLLRRPGRLAELIRHGRRFSDALCALGRGWRLYGRSRGV